MAGMSWEQYYDGFYEWSSGTQIRYLARLDSYGSGAQTAEIAAELAEAGDGGPAAAKRLIMRAVENGVRFTAEDVIEMAGADIEEDTLKYALATVREPLTGSQIVTLSDYFDEDVLEKLIKDKRGGLTPEEIAMAETATGMAESIQRESGEEGFSLEDVLCTDGMEDRILESLSLRNALSHLTERERMVIDLRYFHGLTQQKIAGLLGVSQVQVSRIEKKALTNLRTYL